MRAGFPQRVVAALMALCLVLGQLNGGSIVAYAMDDGPVSVRVGTGVTAEVADGVLTLSGTGDTDDFTAESAPLAAYAADIRALEIEEGVTYLGSYLLYGLGELGGTLTLPSSIVGFGEGVFSGESPEGSPHFAAIDNRFASGEVVRQEQGYAVERVEQPDVAHSETLFCEGQMGTVTCSDENTSFLEAALSAGYQRVGEEEAGTPEGEMADGANDGADDEVADVPHDEAPVPYSEAVDVQTAATTVYVDQTNGNDANDGATEAVAVRTLDAAAQLLSTTAEGGTVETNRIVIVGRYERSKSEEQLFATRPVPVTLEGAPGAILAVPDDLKKIDDRPLFLYEDFCMQSIAVESINHIYGDGYNLTIGEGMTGNSLYLYGFGKSDFSMSPGKVAHLTVKSGTFERIIGYVRSRDRLNCDGYTSNITIEGTAYVKRIVAGSASGEIQNANVNINVESGTVDELIGGNQGYNISPSPFSGTTSISINGGTVTKLYGAGSGRNKSVPTYRGSLEVSVTGGTVANLYGAGSAAYVISDEAVTSEVAIAVSGGLVGNLFAAGKGWDEGSQLGSAPSASTSEFVGGVDPNDFGSLTGNASIVVDGAASVGNIYASGEGYLLANSDRTKHNAYLSGTALIDVRGGTVTGSIYGGGKGIAEAGYEECARVTSGSDVQVKVSGGTVQGNVYGGGQQGLVEGATCVNIEGGTVNGSVYGGALGTSGAVLVLGGSTVNMTGGWVRGNVYGGSGLSDDGAALAEGASMPDLIVANLVGGTVSGNVFGGGYLGKVNGSTHMHIGMGAMGACAYYAAHPDEIPSLTASALSIGGSVYAGGDFGGDGTDYNTITVEGTSHVYVDGTGYDTGAGAGDVGMTVSGGVFGSGASCDAGNTRLVTLRNYGAVVAGDDGTATGTTRTLAAIQRADRVLLLNSHVRLTGQSDAANTDQTTLYSLNRIGDHGVVDGLGALSNGLVLQGGSTLVLESPAMELAAFRSLDAAGDEVESAAVAGCTNTLLLDTGTLLRVSCTDEGGSRLYGPVRGFARLLAGESAEGYVYARIAPDGADGGFVDKADAEISFTEVSSASLPYRYWEVRGAGDANVTRQTVLTARTLSSGDVGYGADGYAVAKGVIELPPADQNSTYTVKSGTVANTALTLVEAARAGQGSDAAWRTSADNAADGSGSPVDVSAQRTAMASSPLTAFGLFMKTGDGFSAASTDKGKIVSALSLASGSNTVIGAQTAGGVTGDHVVPQIEFYLTYFNSGITASRDLGTVTIEFERSVNGSVQETTTANVQIVTRTTNLSSLEVDLYATQAGTYTGKPYIPAGARRKLTLTGVAASQDASLVAGGASLNGNEFAVSLRATRNQGWQSAGLMESPCDLGGFQAAAPVAIGTTDSRYEAPIEFVLTNASGFPAKTQDVVRLARKDESGDGAEVAVTVRVHWEESAVSSVAVGAGRQYNGLSSSASSTISQRSALTAAFALSKTLSVSACWIELQDASGAAAALPPGAELTLLSGTGYYRYRATGTETGAQVKLGSFVSMSTGASLVGSVSASVAVNVDFGPSTESLAVGDYSLRLRNEGTADSLGADCTVNNAHATLALAGGDGPSRGAHAFDLALSANSDTRFSDGAAVVLSLGGDGSFPEGTAFVLDGTTYYASGGKAYLPLSGSGPCTVTVDTADTAGLPAGSYALVAQVFPTGASAGNASALSAQASSDVEQNPSYGLTVSLDPGASRVVSAGDGLTFTVGYSVQHAGATSPAVAVSVQKKTDGGYEDGAAWTVSGNDALGAGSGTQALVVTVPDTLDPGTYRLLFTLGDQTAPYNLIVSG